MSHQQGDRRFDAAAHEDLARAGARDAPVELVEYDPAWPACYATERDRLQALLGGVVVHHIGSTSVPGMVAKPVIDMMALVHDFDPPIEVLVRCAGYQYPEAFNATLVGRRFFCYPTPARRTHHLHLVDERDELDRYLRFRDRLRADPAIAQEYATLKRTLAKRYANDREAYTEAKTPFIRRIEQLPGGLV